MLLWLTGAPTYDPNDKESEVDVCNFVDSIISCSSKGLSDSLIAVQTHEHSHACFKKFNQNECRFDIPYFPMKKTSILKPLSTELSKRKKEKFKTILQRIQKKKNCEKSLKLSYEEFLVSVGVSHKTYLRTIRSTLKKAQIFLKRKPCDMFISPYSKNDTSNEKQYKLTICS